MAKICPAIKKSCKHFDNTKKNKCGMRKPRISNNGKNFYCKDSPMSSKIMDLGLFSLITEGTKK